MQESLVSEFLLLLQAIFIIGFIAIYLLVKSLDTPIPEMKLVVTGLLLAVAFLIGALPAAFLYSIAVEEPVPVVNLSFRTGFALMQIGMLIASLAFYLPDFKNRYRNIIFLIFLVAIDMTAAVANFYTLDITTNGLKLLVSIDPLALIFTAGLIILFFFIILKRIREVTKIVKTGNPFITVRSLAIYTVLFGLTFTVVVINRLFPFIPVPTFSFTLPLSAVAVYLTYAFSKSKAFFFITPTNLEAINIVNRFSGITLFASSEKGISAEMLFGGLFTALSYSLKEILKSQEYLESVSFGDKTVIIAPGRWVTTLMLVSNRNLIATSICKYLTRKFEKMFQEELACTGNRPGLAKTAIFEPFSQEINEIRKYFPR
ncbi:MAG: hypothetical protein ACFFD4_09960 [Candidatus Odinarchaeota archaeon]